MKWMECGHCQHRAGRQESGREGGRVSQEMGRRGVGGLAGNVPEVYEDRCTSGCEEHPALGNGAGGLGF